MYTIGAPATALIVGGGATQLPGAAGTIAQDLLPFTGIACGAWLATGVGLIVVGLVLRRLGAVHA